MRRREFITLAGAAAAAWPLAAFAQQKARPVVGFVHTAAAAVSDHIRMSFSLGLRQMGFVDGQNATIEFRWAEGQYNAFARLIGDVVAHHAAVIVTGGGNAIIEAAKAVTRTTPIVFVTGDDPVRAGTVSSLSRPAGNVTGFAFFNSVLAAKRIELLHEILPSAKIIAFLANPNSADVDEETKAAETAARSLGLDLLILRTASEQDIEINFALLQTRRAQAVVMAADPFLGSQRDRLAVLAIGHAVPLIGTTREYVPAGALISYGTSVTDAYRQAGLYVGRILNGEKPSDLPILQPTKFELAINLKTARVLGIDLPPTLLARADEVTE